MKVKCYYVFAGSVADAFTLFEKFETKLQQFSGNLERAAVELAQEDRRGDKQLRQLEAMLIVMDKDAILVVSGTGEVIAQMMTLSLLDQEATTH